VLLYFRKKEINRKNDMYTNYEQMNTFIKIKEREFQLISKLVYSNFGINLTDKKKALIEGRLNKVLKNYGYKSFQDYYNAILEDKTGELLTLLIDKLSTNHTFFFREREHYDFMWNTALKEIVNRGLETNKKEIRIWSAGCSTGEELYSVAILLFEYFGEDIVNWDIGLLGTDISISVLRTAIEGSYDTESIKGLSKYYINKYFTKKGDNHIQIKDDIKKLVLFKSLNLMQNYFPFRGKFDIIFCRNVMIYFDTDIQYKLVNKLGDYTKKGAYLFTGHSESLNKKNTQFFYVKPAIYSKI